MSAQQVDVDLQYIEQHPEILDWLPARDVSKLMFGVKTMTHLVRIDAPIRKDIVKFFGGNHSDMVAWASQVKGLKDYSYFWFHALPEHYTVYKKMVAHLGLPTVAKLVQHRDFNDVVTAYEFLRSDKKRWNRFNDEIVAALPLFPASAHFAMIHDYGMHQMKLLERNQDKDVDVLAALTPTLPVPPFELPTVEGYTILVPRHDADLRRIGNAQKHCVGTRNMGYADSMREGEIWLVAIYQRNLSDGICVEFDAKTGYVRQAQGRLRRNADEIEQAIIDEISRAIWEAWCMANWEKKQMQATRRDA